MLHRTIRRVEITVEIHSKDEPSSQPPARLLPCTYMHMHMHMHMHMPCHVHVQCMWHVHVHVRSRVANNETSSHIFCVLGQPGARPFAGCPCLQRRRRRCP